VPRLWGEDPVKIEAPRDAGGAWSRLVLFSENTYPFIGLRNIKSFRFKHLYLLKQTLTAHFSDPKLEHIHPAPAVIGFRRTAGRCSWNGAASLMAAPADDSLVHPTINNSPGNRAAGPLGEPGRPR